MQHPHHANKHNIVSFVFLHRRGLRNHRGRGIPPSRVRGRAYFLAEDRPLEGLPEPGRHDVVQDGVDGGTGVHEHDGQVVQEGEVGVGQPFRPLVDVEVGEDPYDVEWEPTCCEAACNKGWWGIKSQNWN